MKRVFKVEYNENEDFEVTVGFICKYCRGISTDADTIPGLKDVIPVRINRGLWRRRQKMSLTFSLD